MIQKKQTLLSITIAFTVMVLIVGITTLPAYSDNSKSEKSIAGITLHCNFKDVDVANSASSTITFVTNDDEISQTLNCLLNDPQNRNKTLLKRFIPVVEVIRIDYTIEIFNTGGFVHDCVGSSSSNHVTTKCVLPDNNKNFVLMTINFAK